MMGADGPQKEMMLASVKGRRRRRPKKRWMVHEILAVTGGAERSGEESERREDAESSGNVHGH